MRTLLSETLAEKVLVRKNGKAVKMSKMETVTVSLVNKAIAGDAKSIGIVLSQMQKVEIFDEEQKKVTEALHEDDRAILQQYMSRC